MLLFRLYATFCEICIVSILIFETENPLFENSIGISMFCIMLVCFSVAMLGALMLPVMHGFNFINVFVFVFLFVFFLKIILCINMAG